jgi:hypothetical protein
MEQLFMRSEDDFDCSNNSPAVERPLNEKGHVLDLVGLQKRNIFSCNGKFWCAQKDFAFPIE